MAKKGTKVKKIFAPFTKVTMNEDGTCTVRCQMTAEVPDRSGETLNYEKSAPLIKAWSDDLEKTSGGKSLGNVREMHQPNAVGKLTEIEFDDVAKTVDCEMMIVDQDAVNKIALGIYTGGSLGGKYAEKWTKGGVKYYSAQPSEFSVVDYPCVPTAVFKMVGIDGTETEVAFQPWQPTASETAHRATELAKAVSDDAKWTDYLEPAREDLLAKHMGEDGVEGEDVQDDATTAEAPASDTPADASTESPAPVEGDAADTAPAAGAVDAVEQPVEGASEKADFGARQVWQAPDGRTFEKKGDCLGHIQKAANPVAAALAGARQDLGLEEAPAQDTEGRPVLKFEPVEDLEKYGKVLVALADGLEDKLLMKGMWEVHSLAEAIGSLVNIQTCAASEAKYEGDGSGVPQALLDQIRGLAETFLEMAREEVGELITMMTNQGIELGVCVADVAIMELCAGATDLVKADMDLMAKVGARNSKNDADRIQAIHDHTEKLGAACAAEKLAKAAKIEEVIAENAELKKMVDEAVAGIGELRVELKKLRDTPLPAAPRTMATINKAADNLRKLDGADASPGTPDAEVAELLKKYSPDELASIMIRASHATGGVKALG